MVIVFISCAASIVDEVLSRRVAGVAVLFSTTITSVLLVVEMAGGMIAAKLYIGFRKYMCLAV